jgi:hypothetical protein
VLRKDFYEGVPTMKTIAAFILAFSFAAPLAAHAAPSVAQKVQQTYHTSFPGVSQDAGK